MSDYVESASELQGMWLRIQTSINVAVSNINNIPYDKWQKKLDNLCNLNA